MLYIVCGRNGEDVYNWEIGRVCLCLGWCFVFLCVIKLCICIHMCVCYDIGV